MMPLLGPLLRCGLTAALALLVDGAAAQPPEHDTGAEPADLATLEGMPSPPVYRDDPRTDGWETEAFSNAAAAQLGQIAGLLEQPARLTAAALASLVTKNASASSLHPIRAREVFRDHSLRVLRRDGPAPADAPRPAPHRGPGGVAAALRELIDGLGDPTQVEVKFKIVAVDRQADQWSTDQLVSISARGEAGVIEQHAEWRVRWTPPAGEEPPRIAELIAGAWEQTSASTPGGGALFSDCTEAVLGGNTSFAEQVMVGTADWLGSIEAALGTDFIGHAGVTIGDVDGDGLEDLYAPQFGGLPNRLFVQNADGTATDRSSWAGVDWLDRSLSSLLLDLDNDGDQDLVIATDPALLIMANDGSGRFTLERALPEVRLAYSLASADYDGDGDLDLYATQYAPLSADPDHVPKPIPYHDAQNGAPNFLLRNDGGFHFVDVTAATGLDADNRRWSFAASWEDYDNDGDQDLYVANDFGRNCLYRNDGGRFVNVAERAGVEDIASGMSVSWGDADGDGWMDLYVGNMFSSAGHRITYQRGFQPGMSPADKAAVQRLARGNSLFMNRGDGTFTDVSLDAAVTMGRWAWSSIFVDLNNDGWKDLVVANGFLSAPDTDDL
ncbi:MAG TPA: VCBS repeat-containing protein [Thermoanaerobaculia bacterium]|nr:VCBS repeat-containing protein [Thermoanaerobaculia bacterium]